MRCNNWWLSASLNKKRIGGGMGAVYISCFDIQKRGFKRGLGSGMTSNCLSVFTEQEDYHGSVLVNNIFSFNIIKSPSILESPAI